MPRNSLQHLPAEDLAALARRMVAGIGPHPANPYGVATGALGQAALRLAEANRAVDAARDAYRAAVQARLTSAEACADEAARVANAVYANPAVTPAMVAAIGLSPRAESRTRITPRTPTRLVAEALPSGRVRLQWERAGNLPGVVFRVERLVPGGVWTIVDETTAARITLAGYAPGSPVAFRIVAAKSGRVAAPTGAAVVYGPDFASAPLRIAA